MQVAAYTVQIIMQVVRLKNKFFNREFVPTLLASGTQMSQTERKVWLFA